MVSVSRADRKCAREILSSIESDSNLNQERIANFKSYLSSLGFSQNSEYFSRINSLEYRLKEKEGVEKEKEIISSLPKITKYSGVYSNEMNYHVPVKLCFRYDHLFLSRNYKNKFEKSPGVKISWRFESNGELYLIDSLGISSRNITHILGPPKNTIWPNVWSKEADFLFYGFSGMDSIQKTDLLLKWGFSCVRELYAASLGKKLQDSSILQEGEVGLTKINSNPLVLNILKSSSKRNPSFLLEERNGKIVYN